MQDFAQLPQGTKDLLAEAGLLEGLHWDGQAASFANSYLQRTDPQYDVEGAGKAPAQLSCTRALQSCAGPAASRMWHVWSH